MADEETTLSAARALLGTLTGARAALMHIAAAHLPVERVIALHRDAEHGADALEGVHDALHRRLELLRRAGRASEAEIAGLIPRRTRVAARPPPAPVPAPVSEAAPAPDVVADEPFHAPAFLSEAAGLAELSAAGFDAVPLSPGAFPILEAAPVTEEVPFEALAPLDELSESSAAIHVSEDIAEAVAGSAAPGISLAPGGLDGAAMADFAAALSGFDGSAGLSAEDEVFSAPPDTDEVTAEPLALAEAALEPIDDLAGEPLSSPAEGPVAKKPAAKAPAPKASAPKAPAAPPPKAPASPPPELSAPAVGAGVAREAPSLSLVGARDAAEDENDHFTPPSQSSRPSASPPRPRAVSPLGVRGAGAEDIEAHADGEDASPEDDGDDAPAGSGAAVAGGLKLAIGGKARKTEAPRLTEDDAGTPTNLTPGLVESHSSGPVSIDDAVVHAHLTEALSLMERGEMHKSIQAFTDALDMKHTLVEAHIGRGRCYLELGDYSSAMSDFQRAEDLQPDKPEPHVAIGDLYFARKEYKRAIEFYDQAVELDGSHAMARCRRGISHYYRKNYRQAFQDLQRALVLDPEIPNIRKYVQMAQKKLEKGE